MTAMRFILPWHRRRIEASHAYIARLKTRLERTEEDVAWAHRGPVVLHALMVAEDRRRGDLRLVTALQAVDHEHWSVKV